MGHNCGACKADVKDGVDGRVWDDTVSVTAYCNACLAKYDGVECMACGKVVSHVDTLAGWCDDCNDACDEYLTMCLEDMAANGMEG